MTTFDNSKYLDNKDNSLNSKKEEKIIYISILNFNNIKIDFRWNIFDFLKK